MGSEYQVIAVEWACADEIGLGSYANVPGSGLIPPTLFLIHESAWPHPSVDSV
jgi:hypothetical protein